MGSNDNAGVEIANGLLLRNLENLQELATIWLSEHDHNTTLVMICGVYYSFWKELFDDINPETEKTAEILKQKGVTTISISAANKDDLNLYMDEMTDSGIQVPESPPQRDHLWLLVLHEQGHNWLELPIYGHHVQ